MTQKEIRQSIYEELRKFHGSIGKIAEKVGCHRNTVSQTLRQCEGFEREDIWEAAAEILLELKKEKKSARSKFERLAQEASAIIL